MPTVPIDKRQNRTRDMTHDGIYILQEGKSIIGAIVNVPAHVYTSAVTDRLTASIQFLLAK